MDALECADRSLPRRHGECEQLGDSRELLEHARLAPDDLPGQPAVTAEHAGHNRGARQRQHGERADATAAGKHEQTEGQRPGQPETAPDDLLGPELLDRRRTAELIQTPTDAADAPDPAVDDDDQVAEDRPQNTFQRRERRQGLRRAEQSRRPGCVAQVRGQPAVEVWSPGGRDVRRRQPQPTAGEQAQAGALQSAHRSTRRSSGSLAIRSITRYATKDVPPPTVSTSAPAVVL